MILCQLYTPEEASAMLGQAILMDWKPGKARTKALTGTVKHNLEILPKDSHEAMTLLMPVADSLAKHPIISLECIPSRIHPPKLNKHTKGDYYQPHTDAPWMDQTRTDVACTLWLSDAASYEGGDLLIGGQPFKGQAGQVLIYNCGEIHAVTPVTKGERICVVTWIQSRIRDTIERKLITDFRKLLSKIEKDQKLFLEGSRIYSALLKRWMD